ncbi:MAG: energy-coupling factor transporter ATPase [Erysipelotrichia bacterium]|nr:energy-coupling factor transporter ATPase [Erysipelotrichia bacterium]
MKALEVNNVSFSYDGKHDAVNQISFDVLKGKHVSIIGHNGSGKSTLAKLILGLLNLNHGEIKVFDEVLSEKSVQKIRQDVGIVFQNPDNQFIGATLEDDLAFGLENRQVPREEMKQIIIEFARKVGMEDFLNSEPANLSGGQKQRAAIAGVLAMKPKLIIFDEATSMLDPSGKKEVKKILLEMKKEIKDLTLLTITHDIEEASLSDEIIVIHQGQIVLKGTPIEVFQHEDKLKEIDLDLPFLIKLKKALAKRDFDVSDANNLEEVAKKICQ